MYINELCDKTARFSYQSKKMRVGKNPSFSEKIPTHLGFMVFYGFWDFSFLNEFFRDFIDFFGIFNFSFFSLFSFLIYINSDKNKFLTLIHI